MNKTKTISLPVRIAVLATLVFGGALVAGLPVDALTVSPPTAEFLLEPGVPHNSKIKLFNETQEAKILYVEIVNFAAEGEGGVPSFDFDSEQIGFATWIGVPETTVELAAGASKEIPVTIDTPATASPGGHYAAVFFSEDPPEDGGQVAIGSKVGSLYLARVDGDVIENGVIAQFLSSKETYNRLPVDFAVRFQNTGNTHLRPSGIIEIQNIFGKKSATLDLNATKSATLPTQIRKYDAVWEKEVVDENTTGAWNSFWTEYSNERKNFAFGKYTATVSLAFGTSNALSQTAETSFWVFPWHVILIYILVILILGVILMLIIKQYNKWIIAKAKEVGVKSSESKPAKKSRKKQEKS